jgi:hypothetical protein
VLQQVAVVLAQAGYSPVPPRAKFPLIMEFGILAKFLGKQLSKLPPPARAAALAALEAAIPLVGAAVIAARGALTTIPEPPGYFTENPVRMTDLLILQQVQWFDMYLVVETLNGGK